VTGPDRRERQNSFLEPLELEDLDSRPHHAQELEQAAAHHPEDPDVFDRVTAVPGELDAVLPPTEPPPQDDDSISGLFERATPVPAAPPRRAPSSEPPPVLSAPTSSAKRPSRRNSRPVRTSSRPNLERPSRRPSSPPQPAIELELDLDAHEPEPSPARDSLEIELPLATPARSSRAPAPASGDPQVVAMKDRYATGDFSGALIVAEGILEAHPYHEDARRCRERCTEVLAQMYLARLGSLDQLVRVALSGDEIRWLSLDHRAGFLLSLVDGDSSIETLLDISGMPRLEALRILYGLLDQRVIALSDG
jgi:hypothetical protein